MSLIYVKLHCWHNLCNTLSPRITFEAENSLQQNQKLKTISVCLKITTSDMFSLRLQATFNFADDLVSHNLF